MFIKIIIIKRHRRLNNKIIIEFHQDRRRHNYPELTYSHLDVIEGGYCAFCDRFAPTAAALGRRRAMLLLDADAAADEVDANSSSSSGGGGGGSGSGGGSWLRVGQPSSGLQQVGDNIDIDVVASPRTGATMFDSPRRRQCALADDVDVDVLSSPAALRARRQMLSAEQVCFFFCCFFLFVRSVLRFCVSVNVVFFLFLHSINSNSNVPRVNTTNSMTST